MRNFLQHKYSRIEDGVKVTYTGKEVIALTARNVVGGIIVIGGIYVILVMLCVM